MPLPLKTYRTDEYGPCGHDDSADLAAPGKTAQAGALERDRRVYGSHAQASNEGTRRAAELVRRNEWN